MGAGIHILAWLIAYAFINLLLSHSPSRVSYGYLSGWWCALYCGYIYRVGLNAFLPILIVFFASGCISVIFDWNWVYHDLPSNFSIDLILIFLGQGFVFSSPILVNLLVQKNKKI